MVKDGQEIKKGDLIEKFDVQAIQEAGYDTVVPIVVTNSNNFDDVISEKKNGDKVNFGDQLLMATVEQDVNVQDSSIAKA